MSMGVAVPADRRGLAALPTGTSIGLRPAARLPLWRVPSPRASQAPVSSYQRAASVPLSATGPEGSSKSPSRPACSTRSLRFGRTRIALASWAHRRRRQQGKGCRRRPLRMPATAPAPAVGRAEVEMSRPPPDLLHVVLLMSRSEGETMVTIPSRVLVSSLTSSLVPRLSENCQPDVIARRRQARANRPTSRAGRRRPRAEPRRGWARR
jgi:hypothetical protein